MFFAVKLLTQVSKFWTDLVSVHGRALYHKAVESKNRTVLMLFEFPADKTLEKHCPAAETS